MAQFEMIIRWRSPDAKYEWQRLIFNDAHFVSAVKNALRFTNLIVSVGGYQKGDAFLAAVAYKDALAAYKHEHHIGRARNAQELKAAVNRALATEPATAARGIPPSRRRQSVDLSAPPQTVRTRGGETHEH